MNRIIFFFIFFFIFGFFLFFFFIFDFFFIPWLLLYSPSLSSVRLFWRPYHVRSVLLFGLSLKPLPKLVSGFIFVVGLLFPTETKFFSLRGNDQLLVSTRTELRAWSISYLLTSRRRNFFPPSGPIGLWLSRLYGPTEARYTPVEPIFGSSLRGFVGPIVLFLLYLSYLIQLCFGTRLYLFS